VVIINLWHVITLTKFLSSSRNVSFLTLGTIDYINRMITITVYVIGNGFLYKSLSLLIYSGDPLLHHTISLFWKKNPTFLHASDQAIMHWWCKTKQEKKNHSSTWQREKVFKAHITSSSKMPTFFFRLLHKFWVI